MQWGGFSEGCGLSMIHLIPVFSVATITLVGILYDQKISLATVSTRAVHNFK